MLCDQSTELVSLLLHDVLQFQHHGAREELVQGPATEPVQFVGTGGEGGVFHAKGIVVSRVLCVLRPDIVYRLVVLGVAQGDFVGGDAHDRAVYLVEGLDLLVKAAAIFEAIVGLVEEGERSELGAWDMREGVEEETVDDDVGDEGGDDRHGVDQCPGDARRPLPLVALEPPKPQPHHDD